MRLALTGIQSIAFKKFRNFATKYCDANPKVEESLLKAGTKIRAEVYVAALVLWAIIGAGVGAGIAAFFFFVMGPAMGMPDVILYFFWAVPGLLPVMIFFIGKGLPGTTAKSRGADIDRNLAYAVNYMAAMASANVNPNVIFSGLSGQEIYGEIRHEAGKIARDIEILKYDLIFALKEAVRRAPSIKLTEFLQGIITTITSGGSLKLLFASKAEQYMRENRLEQKGTLETLGVMGESFVTVVVAAPLFLIVMMSVMAMMGQGDTTILYLIIFMMIPMAQFLFVFIIGGMKLGD